MSSETRVGRGEYAAMAYWEMVAREIGQFNATVREGVTNEYGTRTKSLELRVRSWELRVKREKLEV